METASSASTVASCGPLDLLRCPRCAATLDRHLACEPCGLRPAREQGLVDFLGSGREPVPAPHVNSFYEARPFPGYADGDDATTLLDRCRASPFAAALDQSIPPQATVLDAGCGTGQISNFLALAGRRRTLVGADACRASLRLAEGFRS